MLNVPLYRDKPCKRKVWQYEKADYWGMRGFLASADWSRAFKSENPEEKYAPMSPTSSQTQWRSTYLGSLSLRKPETRFERTATTEEASLVYETEETEHQRKQGQVQ